MTWLHNVPTYSLFANIGSQIRSIDASGAEQLRLAPWRSRKNLYTLSMSDTSKKHRRHVQGEMNGINLYSFPGSVGSQAAHSRDNGNSLNDPMVSE